MTSHLFNPYLTNAAEAASEARAKAQDATTQITFVKQDIERLLMITEALWMLLQRAHGYTDDDLKNLINQIDLRDGCLDGKVSVKETLECPACHRIVTVRQPRCMYCGQVLQHDPFAR
jgi:hypothetical protein